MFKTVDGALAFNCKPDRPGTVTLSEESVKGAVSSHNLEFRTTEIKKKIAQKWNNYSAIYLTEQKTLNKGGAEQNIRAKKNWKNYITGPTRADTTEMTWDMPSQAQK